MKFNMRGNLSGLRLLPVVSKRETHSCAGKREGGRLAERSENPGGEKKSKGAHPWCDVTRIKESDPYPALD